jgi:hypothetical protein
VLYGENARAGQPAPRRARTVAERGAAGAIDADGEPAVLAAVLDDGGGAGDGERGLEPVAPRGEEAQDLIRASDRYSMSIVSV